MKIFKMIFILIFVLYPIGTFAENIDSDNDGSKYAWGDNVGWINFAPTVSGVTIDQSTGVFSGYAWDENVGWINFAPTSGGVKTSWSGVSDGGGRFIATAAR